MEYLIWFLWFGAGGALGVLVMSIMCSNRMRDTAEHYFTARLREEAKLAAPTVVLGDPDAMTGCTHEFGGVTVTGDRYTRECRKCGYGELFS